MEQRITETTRYLCAAVQIDEKLCDQILEEFLEEDYTVKGICHAVDLSTILKSCLLAKKRRNKRDIRLASLFLILLVSFFTPLPLPHSFLVIYTIAWIIVFLDRKKIYYGIVGKYLSKNNFNPIFVNLQLHPELENKLKKIVETQNANVIIYGGFSPFVGSGLNINGWSFAIDVSKGKEDIGSIAKPLPFRVNEVYDYITNLISSLKLDGLDIEDNLYISGQEIRGQNKFLPDPLMRPITIVEDAFVKSFIDKPTHAIRHYRCIRITDWQGELILSIFLRFSKIGQNLFVEANYYLLTPLRQYYRQFDAIKSEPSFEDIQKLTLETAFITVEFGIAAPISILNNLIHYLNKKNRKKEKGKEIISNPNFNYGALTSLRERVSQNKYHRFFQKLDQQMYLKVIERKIVDGLSKFLDSKNIDTSDFKEVKSTILNHGVMVSGGSVQAQNLTVGERAKSKFSNVSADVTTAESGN